MKRVILFLFISLILANSVYAATNCDPSVVCSKIYDDYNSLNSKYQDLNSNYNALNKSYLSLLSDYSILNKSYFEVNKSLSQKIEELNKTIANLTKERDYYKALYENSSLGKISVRDFYLNIEKVINNYNTTLQNFKAEINTKFTQVNYYIYMLVLVFVLEIALFRLKLFNLIIKIKGINFIYKKSKKLLINIRKSQKFIKIKNLLFVHEEKKVHSEHK